MSDEKEIVDKLGYPIFEGCTVATSVGVGNSSSDIRIGKVVVFDNLKKEIKIKIDGHKASWRRPSKVIILFNPEFYKGNLL